jgi:hypothetical protein
MAAESFHIMQPTIRNSRYGPKVTRRYGEGPNMHYRTREMGRFAEEMKISRAAIGVSHFA